MLIKLEQIEKQIAGRSILQSVNFSLSSGEIVTLIGPNGAGKSTLVKIAIGLVTPDGGHCQRKTGLRIGYVPQFFHVSESLPMSVGGFLRLHTKSDQNAIVQILNDVGVADIAAIPLQSTSGGERKRLLLARALLGDPDLLVLDEPTAGVDVNGQAEIYRLLQKIRDDRGCGILLVSHDLHLVMAASDRVLCLNHHICCSGEPEDVSRHPEYQALFGDELSRQVAVYEHHHDHQHDLAGDIQQS